MDPEKKENRLQEILSGGFWSG